MYSMGNGFSNHSGNHNILLTFALFVCNIDQIVIMLSNKNRILKIIKHTAIFLLN